MKISDPGLKAAFSRSGLFFLPVVVGLFILYPFLVGDYYIDLAFYFGVYALLGLSLNIVLGEVGLFDLGHAGFFAVGAYLTAILNTRYGIPVMLLLPLSGLAAALFSYVVCSPVIHLRGDYLCIVTIGLGEIVRQVLINNPWDLTGGPNGIFGIDFPSFGKALVIDSSIKYYFLIWAVVGLSILFLISLQNSRIGRAWNCIREDQLAAGTCGIDVRHYKLLAFTLGAGLAGIAGNIYAGKLMGVSPESFTFWESCLMFCIVLIGGLGSIPGVLIGAGFISLFPELFRPFAMYRLLVFGSVMMLMMSFKPQGLWPRRRSFRAFRLLPRDFRNGSA